LSDESPPDASPNPFLGSSRGESLVVVRPSVVTMEAEFFPVNAFRHASDD